MRRPVLLALIVLALALGAYVAYWYGFAHQIRSRLDLWAAQERSQGNVVTWDSVSVDGFPLRFAVRLTNPVYATERPPLPCRASAAALEGYARPWNPKTWQIYAPQGAHFELPPASRRDALSFKAATLEGTVSLDAGGDLPGNIVTASGQGITAGLPEAPVHIGHAEGRLLLPAQPPSGKPLASQLSLAATNVDLPTEIPSLGRSISLIEGTFAIAGSVPAEPRAAALAAWRDQGGRIALSQGRLNWGPLSVAAEGTVALDGALQPAGTLNTAIEGQNEIVDALVAAHTLKPGDASLVKIALGLLARPGPDGRGQITAPLRLQDGRFYLGPARLGSLPHFTWE